MYKKLFLSVLSLIGLLIVAITVSYAWYINKASDDFKSPLITGKSTAAYYAGGDGSKAKPYKIANERHLYNLAWLQYLGTYNQDYDGDGGIDQYYFELIDNIDCQGLILPPIGTTDNPFLGNFNGNGYVVKNLEITNNYINLEKKPSSINDSSKYKGVEIIGFFGVVGKYAGFVDANISSEVNSVYDFYLDDLIIKNSCTNTLAGLIAGFVNANVSNVGVHYGKIELSTGTNKLSAFNNISGYTLIGEYDSELVSWDDKPSYDNGGGAQDFGGTLDFKTMHQRFTLINSNSWTFPTISLDESNAANANILDSKLTNGSYIPLVVENDINQEYYSTNTEEIPMTSNIGYLTGSNAYLEKAPVSSMINDEFIIRDENGDVTDVRVFSVYKDNYNNVHEEVTESIDEGIKNKLIDYVEEDYLYGIRFTAQISHNQPITINNAVVDNSVIDSINVPNSSIWFKPLVSGTAKIISYQANSTRSLSFYELERSSNSSFSTSIVKEEIHMNGVYWNQTFYYFEAEVEAGHEYAIGSANGSDTAHFVYLDIGQNAGSGAPSVDPELKNSAIEGVDFVYLNHSTSEFSSTVDEYSTVFFQISGTTNGLTEFYFRRNNDNEDNYAGSEGIVLYFAKNENGNTWNTTSSGKTDGNSSLDWSYAGTKGEAGASGGYNAEDCEVLADSKSSGGLANTNTGASTTFNITYNYINENGEVVYITKGKVTKGYAITVPTFEVDGYRLITWYTDEGLINEYDFANAVDNNLILYASSEPVTTYIVTFMDGDTVLGTDIVNEGSHAIITTPRKSGYVFSHWEDSSGNVVDISTTQITANTVLTAVWEAAYNVEFAYNLGGEDVIISQVEVKQGYNVSRPEEPELSGYRFVNWYTDTTYSSTFDFDVAPTSDITIYAKFDEIPHYTVTYGYIENSQLITIMIDSIEENTTATKPADPTRSGYVFGGWYSDEGLTVEFDFSQPITENTTIYAYWQKGITITFQYEDGTIIDSIDIMSNNSVTPTSITPAMDGYRFNGNWYLLQDGNVSATAFDFTTVLLEDTTLVPGWIKTYDVTFVNNNNTSNTTTTVDTGTEVIQPDNPTYEGYKFVGWYEDEACTISQSFPITVTEDMTIYAKWAQLITIRLIVDGNESYVYTEENQIITLPDSMDGYYLISWSDGENVFTPGQEIIVTGNTTYEANAVKKYTVTVKDGTTTIDTLTSDVDGYVTLPAAPTNGNAVFAGWSDGNNVYAQGETISVTSNMTITATWTYSESVVFDANGGTFTGSTTVIVTLTNGLVTSLPEEPTREDYTFLGWYLDAECSIELDTNTPIAVNTIYAGWEEVSTRTVIFYANEGKFSDDSTSIEVKVKSNGTISAMPEEPTREGYMFYCWYVKQNSGDANEIILTESTVIEEGYNVYAYWSKYYSLTVNCMYNGNTILKTTVSVPTEIELDSYEAPIITGYTATGWYSNNNCTNPLFPHTFGQWWNSEVYIKYELVTYTVSFETNGGSSIESQDIIDGEVLSTVENPTKLGYEFAGWYTNSELTNSFDISTPITSDLTLYAKWTEVGTATITYVLNGGEGITNDVVTIGTTITYVPSKSGYEFAGWYTNSELTNSFDISTPITSDLTLYAKWNMFAGYNVTFDVAGGTEISSQQVEEGQRATKPSQPTKAGYQFAGWYVDSSYTQVFNFEQNITGDTIIYAKWIIPSEYDFVIDVYVENTSTGVQEYFATLTYNIGEYFFTNNSTLMEFLAISENYVYNKLRILNDESNDLDSWLYNSQVHDWWWFTQLVVKVNPTS